MGPWGASNSARAATHIRLFFGGQISTAVLVLRRSLIDVKKVCSSLFPSINILPSQVHQSRHAPVPIALVFELD